MCYLLLFCFQLTSLDLDFSKPAHCLLPGAANNCTDHVASTWWVYVGIIPWLYTSTSEIGCACLASREGTNLGSGPFQVGTPFVSMPAHTILRKVDLKI
jgi:hypothetical protein